jgi:hypothetical protein
VPTGEPTPCEPSQIMTSAPWFTWPLVIGFGSNQMS